MAEFNLGNRTIEVPVFNFRKLKKAWPLFQKAANVDPENPMASFDEAIGVVLIGLEKTSYADLTKEVIEEELTGPQVIGMQKLMTDIMKESGLVTVKKDGTATGNGESGEESLPASSTEISTPSSLNSLLPDAKVEAGTE